MVRRNRLRVADRCIQTAGESDKMRITHATETASSASSVMSHGVSE